jgi:hypothetical protein
VCDDWSGLFLQSVLPYFTGYAKRFVAAFASLIKVAADPEYWKQVDES